MTSYSANTTGVQIVFKMVSGDVQNASHMTKTYHGCTITSNSFTCCIFIHWENILQFKLFFLVLRTYVHLPPCYQKDIASSLVFKSHVTRKSGTLHSGYLQQVGVNRASLHSVQHPGASEWVAGNIVYNFPRLQKGIWLSAQIERAYGWPWNSMESHRRSSTSSKHFMMALNAQ